MGRIEDLGLVADKGLEWKAKCGALTAERDQLRAENERLRADTGLGWNHRHAELLDATARAEAAEQQLEFDRTTCHNFINALDAALDGRFWLTEGRGSYSWDDDRYRAEFHDAAVALRSILDPMRKMAKNLSSRLPTTEAVMKARVDLEHRAEAAERERDEARAHAADLRGVMEAYADETQWGLTHDNAKHCDWFIGRGLLADKQDGWAVAKAALARTPAESLGRLKAEALRGLTAWVHQSDDSGEVVFWSRIEAEADRLEATDGR
jgi:hypothetical protein